jgi:hypothetical protein
MRSRKTILILIHGMKVAFMEEWADPRALSKIPALCAPFEIAESAKALNDLLRMFTWMAQETAEHKHHPDPLNRLKRLYDWIESMSHY